MRNATEFQRRRWLLLVDPPIRVVYRVCIHGKRRVRLSRLTVDFTERQFVEGTAAGSEEAGHVGYLQAVVLDYEI